MALGSLLRLMGGRHNLEQALAIFTRLRIRATGAQASAPCDDKHIELALALTLEAIGGAANLQKALAIYTRLRTQAAGGRANTPCSDKDIELSLGKLFQLIGGAENMDKALAIYTRLRSQAAQGKEHTPCDDPEIELTLACHFVARGMWQAFDELQLEARPFSGEQTFLCLSVRYFHELLEAPGLSPAHSRLLGQAIKFAVLALESCRQANASCISQLGHCIRLLSHWPDALLAQTGIQKSQVRSLTRAATFLFKTADAISPHRLFAQKDQDWRKKEQELLGRLSRQRVLEGGTVRTACCLV